MTNDTRTEGQVGRHGAAVVNGPEDEDFDSKSIDWQRVEDDVRRLRQRIFTGLLEPGAMKVARRVLRGPPGQQWNLYALEWGERVLTLGVTSGRAG